MVSQLVRSCQGRHETNNDMAQPEKQSEKEPISRGTVLAEKERTKANRLTEREREALFEEGMGLIYGGPNKSKAAVNCR